MRIVLPRRKVVLWTLALLVAAVVGGAWFAYDYATDSRTLAALIRAEAPRYLPGTTLDLGRVRIRPFAGEGCRASIGEVEANDRFLEVVRAFTG